MIRPQSGRILFIALALLVFAIPVNAHVPHVINYQGRLTNDAGDPINEPKLIKFTIYGSPDGDDDIWTSGFQTVQIDNGLFNYELGSNVALPENLFTGNDPRYIGMTVDTGAELAPRVQFISVAYANHAAYADSVGNALWSVDGNQVSLENINDSVLVGAATPEGKLTVHNDESDVTGVLGHDSAAVYGYSQYSSQCGILGKSKGDPVKGVNLLSGCVGSLGGKAGIYATDGGSSLQFAGRFHGNLTITGKIGIHPVALIAPEEDLVIGRNVGSYSGHRLVIGDNEAGVSTGLVVGEDDDNRCWVLWNVDNNYLDIGTKEAGTGYGNTMTIRSDQVGIKTVSPNYTLDVRGTIGNNTTLYHSDARWKTDIQTIPGALEKVTALRGVSFEWRQDEFAEMNFPSGKHIGVIAQEVENVLPELVNTAKDGYKSVEYANLTALLIESVKELKEENEKLKQRMAKLESQVNE